MADETQIPAGETAPQTEVSAPPPQETTTADPSAAAAAEPAADAGAETAAEAEGLKRADAEPTLLEGVKTEKAAKPEADKDDAKATDDAAKAATDEAEAKAKTEADAKADADKKAADDKAAADKAAEEAKKPGDEEKTEAEKTALEPVEYKYTLPETLKMTEESRAEAHAAFDAFRADPANPQPLIDLHNARMADYAAEVERNQHAVFAETRAGWRKEIMADPDIGGANHETAKMDVAAMRDMFASSAKPGTEAYEQDLKQFDDFLRITGAGDHPVLWKMLHRVSATFKSPSARGGNINPPADIGRSSKRGSVYNHPTSPQSKAQ